MNRPVTPSDPPTDPPFYVGVGALHPAPRPSPRPRSAPTPAELGPLPDPPIYRQVAAELLWTPLPPAHVRRGRV